MKKYNTLLVVVITILFVALLTWIFPITYLSGELTTVERSQAGLINIFSYSGFTFYNFIYVLLYLLGIGGIYGLLNKTGAYRILLDRISGHVKERKVIWLVITVLIIALISSFTGFTFEMLIVLPFIAGVILLLGYDKVTAGMVTIGSISVGIIGTTFSKLVAGTFNQMLGTTYNDLVIVKAVLLIVCAAILIVNVILHAKKIEKTRDPEESFLLPEKVKERNVKVWPLVTILSIFMLVLVLGTVDWTGAFNVTIFDTIHNEVMNWKVLSRYVILTVSLLVVLYNVLISIYRKHHNITIGDKLKEKASKFIPSIFKNNKLMGPIRLIVTIIFGIIAFLALLKIVLEDIFNATYIMTKIIDKIKLADLINNFTFAKLLGSVQSFGNWTYIDYFSLMMVLALVIKFTYHIKFEKMLDSVNDGFKKVLYGSFVCMLAYTILIITSSHPVILTILKPLLNVTDGLNILLYPICTFVSALCNTDFTYYQYGVLNLSYATNYFTSASVYPLCGLITQSMYGLALMVAPTSVVLLFSLSILEIKYTTWFKKMWLPILEIVLAIFVCYIIVLQFMV